MTETTMNTQPFLDDIPRVVAIRAHAGTSFDAESRGDEEINKYASTLATDFENLSKYASTDEKRATFETEFACYRQGYKVRALAYFHSKGRCYSPMITGPSNFPIRRMEKRNRVCDKRLNELCEFRRRALEAIRKALNPEWRPIMAGDADALDRLKAKLAEAEKMRDIMREVNAAIRHHAKDGEDAQVRAMIAIYPKLDEADARELLLPDFGGRIGFPDYALTNNNANIRRMKSRIELLSRDKAAVPTTQRGENGVLYQDCPADNRVRLFFPYVPDVFTRTRLKAQGFRWTPSLRCWQAYRNSQSLAQAKHFMATLRSVATSTTPIRDPIS
jgi:hypothetical protein